MDLDSPRQSSVANFEQKEVRGTVEDDSNESVNPKPGRLYFISNLGQQALDWVDPVTGVVLLEPLPHVSSRSQRTRDISEIMDIPVMFLSSREHQGDYWAYNFLVFEKILQVVLQEKQNFNDYFIQVSA